MANTMVTLRSSELGPMGWEAVTKRQLFLQNVSSRLRSKPGLPAAVLVQVSSSLASTTTAAQAQRPKPGGTGRDGRPSGTASPPRGRTIPTGAKTRMTERVTAASSDSPTTAPATSRHSQIPAGAAVARLPSGSKLPVKGLPTSLSSSSLGSIVSESNPAAKALGTKSEEKPSCAAPAVGSQVTGKPPTSRPTRIRNRATSFHEKSSSTVMKTPVMAGHALSKTTHSPLQRHGSARMIRPSAAVMVDKNKPKGSPAAAAASPRATSCQTSVQPGPATPQEEKPTVAAHHCLQCEKKGQCIQQLRKLLLSGTRRLEALALVVQHIFAEREEALKQKNELAVELTSLRKELGSFMSSYDRVEKEKEEVQERFEAVVQKLEEKHRAELTQLEERLRAFFTAEMDKNQQASEEEAEKYRALMQQEVEEVQSKQEALWREQEEGHNQQMEALKQQYKITMEEMKKTYEQEMQSLDQNLKELEVSHSEQMQQLTTENNVLNEKIKEEEQRRMLAAKSQKDALTSYLEQELESLKVVLDLKNQKLHQQEKKLMQMDKLIETNVKLEESLKKVQQENEDYRARMDKHAALTKQLSTEQAVLQQTLQMESKVNKRLSMENEELLWKLHNGDLSSPRRLSPTSPFSSPRNSASFSAAPLSPR
ncbi:microtubule-associated tumor suppressor 1 homolog A isoform X3 [Denticeps clupeoides]|uniref:microtubule-associated tumor suppressor 1 homolog A isoform X3 n=1 Tax=Denticeps clupeoides TaxID=299321 RepID=UPI0010A34002|nr:microtubule-associated tumor suppressor 1 isoform X3 [Denticeps clupeoides]